MTLIQISYFHKQDQHDKGMSSHSTFLVIAGNASDFVNFVYLTFDSFVLMACLNGEIGISGSVQSDQELWAFHSKLTC